MRPPGSSAPSLAASATHPCSSVCSPRQIILGAAVALTPVNVIQLLIGTQVLQGLISPIVLVYLLVLTNRRTVLGPAANGPRYRIAATIVVLAVAAMSTILLVQTDPSWLGWA